MRRVATRAHPVNVATERVADAANDPRLEGGGWREALEDDTAEAVGAMTEALETVEVARGYLYAFHQRTGSAAFKLERAVELLGGAGHVELAELLTRELLGRNVFEADVKRRRRSAGVAGHEATPHETTTG
jgi:hypothetical protein